MHFFTEEVRTGYLKSVQIWGLHCSAALHKRESCDSKSIKGPAISPIEAHNERTKEQYASNPDIDTSRSRYNLHLVQPQGRYREEADRMIAAAHFRVRKDSVRVVEALVTVSPEFFKDKTNREIRAYFAYALKFLEGKQRPDTFLSASLDKET